MLPQRIRRHDAAAQRRVGRPDLVDEPLRAIAFQMNEVFSPVLKQKCEFYATNGDADVISSVKSRIDATRDVMVENIDRILERGEKIELLVDKTENCLLYTSPSPRDRG